MSYRITGPNLDKTMSATETKSVLCANKMMSGNIVISRVTSESENLVITGPNLSKTDTTGTILCANKMMSGNVQFAHTGKVQIYWTYNSSNKVNVTYNNTTINANTLVAYNQGGVLKITITRDFGASGRLIRDMNGNILAEGSNYAETSYQVTLAANINAVCIFVSNGYTYALDGAILCTGTNGITNVSLGITGPSGSDTGYYIGYLQLHAPSGTVVIRSGNSAVQSYYPRNADCKLGGSINLVGSEYGDKFYYNLTLDGVSKKSGKTSGTFITDTLKINAANLHGLWRGKERTPSYDPAAFVFTTS